MAKRGDNVGSDQIKTIVERIRRMKEEARAIKDDIREIYAEAKDNGFDKTVLGQIVSYVEKREKDPDTLAERSALFELYLSAIDGVGTVDATHRHTHEPTAFEQIRDGLTEALAVSRGEAEPYRVHHIEPAHSDPSGAGGQAEEAEPNGSDAVASSAEPENAGVSLARAAGSGSDDARASIPQPSGQQIAAPVRTGAHSSLAGAEGDADRQPFQPGSIRYESTPAVGVVWHDYLRCFPELGGSAFGNLKDDIDANGIQSPIIMHGCVVLDGRARFLAARDLHLDYPVLEYSGDDPLRDIIAFNTASRKLNLVERQAIAKKLIKLAPDREADIADFLDLAQLREVA